MALIFSDAWINTTNTGFAIASIWDTVYFDDVHVQNASYVINPYSIKSLAASGNSVTFYQGTIPTATQMNTFIPNSRASDMILQFTSASTTPCIAANLNTILINFGGILGTIINPGTMSWFSISNSSTSFVNSCQFFGTVGLTGSGSDLILPKTTVVLNDLWICTNLYFNMGNAPVQI